MNKIHKVCFISIIWTTDWKQQFYFCTVKRLSGGHKDAFLQFNFQNEASFCARRIKLSVEFELKNQYVVFAIENWTEHSFLVCLAIVTVSFC